MRLTRPPVMVSAPVSTTVTRHASFASWWTTLSRERMSNVTSQLCSQ